MRHALLAAILALCLAWTSETDDADGTTAGEDTSTAECIDSCKREDHPGCTQGCTAARWPSCSISYPH